MKWRKEHEMQALRQFVFEVESWRRTLAFQREELVNLKQRLAELTELSQDAASLAAAENLQEAAIAHEQLVDFFTGELSSQTRLLEKDLYIDGELFGTVLKDQKRLRRQMKREEVLFTGVKRQFTAFFGERF